jgi:hypothetical protein
VASARRDAFSAGIKMGPNNSSKRRAIPLAALRKFSGSNVFNPWADADPLDALAGDGRVTRGPAARIARLTAHFRVSPALVLVGEASGYQGCHFSGIPFTNEKLILEGRVPRVIVAGRLTRRERPWCEPSATVMWNTLHDLGLAHRVVLWNAFAWHPFQPGKRYSNRTPTRSELAAGSVVLKAVLDIFATVPVVAVGKVAERVLRALGRAPTWTVRHPSMGGARKFRAGLEAIARALPMRRDHDH